MTDKAPVLAPFHMTQLDGNITAGSDGSTGVWGDCWKYQVPQGTGIVLQAGDQFSAYLTDTGPAECGTTTFFDCQVKIEVRDPSEQDIDLIFGPTIYKRVREFENRNTIARLGLAAPVKVYPRQWIVIVVKDTGTLDVSLCYFDLLTSKVAIPL